MKNKLIVILLATMIICVAAGCTAPSEGNNDVQNVLKTDGGELTSPVGVSSSVTAATVSGGMYLKISGHTQGEIKGECSSSGDKKDTVALVDFSDGVIVPTDPDTGLPTGRRMYDAVKFVHKIDRTSSQLHKALSSGEQLDLTVDFYRIKGDGTEEKYYSIIYEDAIIVSMEIFTGERNTHFEEVSFNFGKVTYVFNDGNISFGDTWK